MFSERTAVMVEGRAERCLIRYSKVSYIAKMESSSSAPTPDNRRKTQKTQSRRRKWMWTSIRTEPSYRWRRSLRPMAESRCRQDGRRCGGRRAGLFFVFSNVVRAGGVRKPRKQENNNKRNKQNLKTENNEKQRTKTKDETSYL